MAKEKTTDNWDDFNIGDQVHHAKWGDGTVMFKTGGGETSKVIVVFPEEGQKKLMLKYAKLKKLGSAAKAAAKAAARAAAKEAEAEAAKAGKKAEDEEVEVTAGDKGAKPKAAAKKA